MRRRTLAVAALALAGLVAAPAAAQAKDLIGSGSTAAYPFLLPLFKAYEKQHHSLHFVYTPNGGNAGVLDVQQGRSMFAAQARPPLPSDTGTIYIKLFLDGLCIDVHPGNSVKNVSITTLRNIYSGNATSWTEVPGSNLTTTIDAVGRDTNGGTYTFFNQAVLGGNAPFSGMNALPSDGEVATAVKNDPNAIGYIGLGYQGKGLVTEKVNGIACAPKQIKALRYPLSRYLWLVLPSSNPSKQVEKFADWVRTSHDAGVILTKAGAVPAFNKGF